MTEQEKQFFQEHGDKVFRQASRRKIKELKSKYTGVGNMLIIIAFIILLIGLKWWVALALLIAIQGVVWVNKGISLEVSALSIEAYIATKDSRHENYEEFAKDFFNNRFKFDTDEEE